MFKKIIDYMLKSRQEEANIKIAEILHRIEYKHETFDYVLEKVRSNVYGSLVK